MIEGDVVQTTNKKPIKLKCNISCTTPNVIYAIYCNKCDATIYVGETGRTLYERMQNHLSAIRCKKMEEPVAHHFNGAGHMLSNFKFLGLQCISNDNMTYRRLIENNWMRKLNTFKPYGLNVKSCSV
jgi:adenine-specific DNA methylase